MERRALEGLEISWIADENWYIWVDSVSAGASIAGEQTN